MRLMEVQEYCVEDCLPHVRNLLEHISLEGGGPHPKSRLETTQGVMVEDRRGQNLVNDTDDGLPQELH